MNELPRVLVVDDQPTNLQVVGGVLRESKKYRVSFAQSGEEALKLVDTLSPDLILLDVMMPGMGGLEVCEQLKKTPVLSAVPIIFLTAKSEAKDMVEGFEVGGADYITKPFEPAVLLARVEAHLQLYLYNQREEEMRSKERITSYQNGLTEMGASVLHNIGNALVGVNSRIAPIEGMATKMSDLGAALNKAYILLDEEGDQARVLQILDLGAKLLKEEYASVLKEDAMQLKASIYHVNEIIDAQRSLTTKGLMSSHFAVESMMADVTTLLDDELDKRKVRLLIESKGEIPEVFLPRSPLGQVVVNLVKNSYEAISEPIKQNALPENEGKIQIRLMSEVAVDGESKKNSYWYFDVIDNGVGIAAADLDSVLLSGYSTKLSSAGLGLHSAANFSVAMGGELKVMSDGPNQGTQIRIRLPLECSRNCYQVRK